MDDVRVEAVGCDGNVSYGVRAVVDVKSDFHMTPGELCFFEGMELLPFGVQILVGGDVFHGILNLFQRSDVLEIDVCCFSSVNLFKGLDQR